MTLRDRLLAKLREPDYRPANNFILGRLLGLNKKQSAALASEVRHLVKSREVRLGDGGRVELAGGSKSPAKQSSKPAKSAAKPDLKERFKAHVENNKVSSRPIFQPAQRGPQGDPFAPTSSAPTPAPSYSKSAPTKFCPAEKLQRQIREVIRA